MKIYRGGVEIYNLEIDDNTKLTRSLMGEDYVQLNYISKEYLDFQLKDTLEFRDETFTIFTNHSVRRSQANEFVYQIDFQSEMQYFRNALFMFEGSSDFSFTGRIDEFLTQVINSVNRVYGSARFSYLVDNNTAINSIAFADVNCVDALTMICEVFEYEFVLIDSELQLEEKIENEIDLTLEFKSGLRTFEKKKINDENLVTRLYAFGSDRNITSGYGGVGYSGRRLKLDEIGGYLSRNENLYGVIEKVKVFEDIYPHRTGTVTAIDSGNIYKFRDSTMPFDLNDQLLPATVAKVNFTSGELTGYTLEISNYDDTLKEFTIKPFDDVSGFSVPDVFTIGVNDEYVLLNIEMPSTYIEDAEDELKVKANEYLNKNCVPNTTYDLEPDYVRFRRDSIQLNIGDSIWVNDSELSIHQRRRILSFTQSLANEYLYTLTAGDSFIRSRISDLYYNAKKDQAKANQASILLENSSNAIIVKNEKTETLLDDVIGGNLDLPKLTDIAPTFTYNILTLRLEATYIPEPIVNRVDFFIDGAYKSMYNGGYSQPYTLPIGSKPVIDYRSISASTGYQDSDMFNYSGYLGTLILTEILFIENIIDGVYTIALTSNPYPNLEVNVWIDGVLEADVTLPFASQELTNGTHPYVVRFVDPTGTFDYVDSHFGDLVVTDGI